jgi:hypothetical protein
MIATVVRTLRAEVAVARATIALALRAWRTRATADVGNRLRHRNIDRLSDHMLRDIGLPRQAGRKAVDWLSQR